MEMRRVFACGDRVRLRAGGDQDRAGRELGFGRFVPDAVSIASLDRDCESARAAMRIDFDRERRQALGEAHALLQRFLDFLVIERVRRTVEQAPAITATGNRSGMLATESRRAAPVSCNAMRKSDAVRTPLASPFGRSSTVGLPAPAQSAM